MRERACSVVGLAIVLGIPLNAVAFAAQDEARQQWSESVRGAIALFRDGKTPEAEVLLRRAIQDASSVQVEPAAVAAVWGVLGRVYEELGRVQESERAHRKEVTGYEKILAPDDGRVIRAMANLVTFYLRTGQVGKIERLEARCRWLAATEPRTVQHGWLMNALGMVSCYRGRFEEAETALTEALSIEEQAGGDDALRNDIRANLGAVYLATSRAAQARELYRQVVHDEELRVGDASPRLTPALASLAASCHLAGHDSEATAVLERGIVIAEGKLPSYHPMRVRLLSIYAHVLRALHRDKEAKTAEKQALAVKRELEKDNPSGLIVDVSELSNKSAPAR